MDKLGTIIKIKRLPEAATAKNGIYITGPIFRQLELLEFIIVKYLKKFWYSLTHLNFQDCIKPHRKPRNFNRVPGL